MKTKVLLCALAVATLFAAPGVGAQTSSLDPQMCLAEEPRQMTNEYYWRWRAYQDLGCLMSKLEQAMNGPANIGKDHVTLPRAEVQELLKLAWGARDATQRIGR
jgi:hypothetical protein